MPARRGAHLTGSSGGPPHLRGRVPRGAAARQRNVVPSDLSASRNNEGRKRIGPVVLPRGVLDTGDDGHSCRILSPRSSEPGPVAPHVPGPPLVVLRRNVDPCCRTAGGHITTPWSRRSCRSPPSILRSEPSPRRRHTSSRAEGPSYAWPTPTASTASVREHARNHPDPARSRLGRCRPSRPVPQENTP